MASQQTRKNNGASSEQSASSGQPDVVLDIPQLKVDEINMEVDSLHARIALEARLGELIHLHVGADAQVDRVALEIKGVEAQAQLQARLDNVLAIMERALSTVDDHPEVLVELSRQAGQATGNGMGLLESTTSRAGELATGAEQDDEESAGDEGSETDGGAEGQGDEANDESGASSSSGRSSGRRRSRTRGSSSSRARAGSRGDG